MTVREPKKRSNLRLKLGGAYFSAQRKLRWLSMRKHFARERSGEDLAYQAFSHHTPLMRKLKDVDMQLQRNKVTNLRLACARGAGDAVLCGGGVESGKRQKATPSSSRSAGGDGVIEC